MELLVWECVATGNACKLDPLENVEFDTNLLRGRPFGDAFPKDALFRMAKRHKKNTALVDSVSNSNGVLVCSKRLVEFLQSKKLKGLEYLPVTILNHKDKVASTDYFIVHQTALQDILDVGASKPTYNLIEKGMIDEVEKFVVDPKKVAKIDKGIRLFRMEHYRFPVMIDKELADEIEAEGFVGPFFQPPEEYGH